MQMMFHSYELTIGKYGIYETPEGIEKLFRLFEDFFIYLRKGNVRGITLKDYYSLTQQQGTERTKPKQMRIA